MSYKVALGKLFCKKVSYTTLEVSLGNKYQSLIQLCCTKLSMNILTILFSFWIWYITIKILSYSTFITVILLSIKTFPSNSNFVLQRKNGLQLKLNHLLSIQKWS